MKLDTPQAVEVELAHLKGLVQEEFWVIALNTKLHEIKRRMIFRGTLNQSLIHPREIFRFAIVNCAANIIAVHNHPSGEQWPSDEDNAVTDRLAEAGSLLGIKLLDHIILASGGYYSYLAMEKI